MNIPLKHSILFVFSLLLMASCKEKSNTTPTDNPTSEVDLIAYQCPMDCEKGKTYHAKGSCPVCHMDLAALDQSKKMTCTLHKDGNCKCEGEKCSCVNCAEHRKKMTCTLHKDGNCKCEGEKCACTNCPEHS